MNMNLVNVVKQIIAANGEAILADPARLKAFFSDLARDEPKPLRIAFGRCVEAGAYNVLKTAPDAAERASRKADIAQRLRDDQGLDASLCGEALDVLEAAVFGTASAARKPAPPQSPSTQTPGHEERPAYTPPAAQTYPQAAPAAPAPPKPAFSKVFWAFMGSLSIFIICFVLIGSIGSESEEGLVALAFIIPVFFLFLVIIWPVDGQMLARAASGMSLVEGGTFMMGQNQVTADNFYISGHEVTSGEWQELMGNNQVPLINNKNPAYRMPAANISWYDAVDYCNRRSWREGLNPAYTITGTDVIWNGGANGYRLPTEAEWECAYRTKTIKGNMYEWCWDAAGPSAGASRILRCGSWRTGWRALLAGRYSLAPMGRSKYTGFRVAINP